jgi:glycosyltransferase involved in cell wall biosynthesis
VAENEVGVVVDGTDPAAVVNALRELRDSPEERRAMGERGRRIVEQGMNWGDAAKSLVGAYERLQTKLGRPG